MVNPEPYRNLGKTVTEVPSAVGSFGKNVVGIFTGTAKGGGKAATGIAGGLVGLLDMIAGGAASITNFFLKATNAVLRSRTVAGIAVFAVAVGAYLGISKSMKARDQRIAAEQAELAGQISSQNQANAANMEAPFHPANDAGDRWSKLAAERVAKLEQPVSAPAAGR